MKTAQAGTLVAKLGEYKGLRLFRKHCYRLRYVRVASTLGFQVQDAVIWGALPSVSAAWVRPIDHAQRQIGRLGAPAGGDIHEVFHAPVLGRIPTVTREVEPSPLGSVPDLLIFLTHPGICRRVVQRCHTRPGSERQVCDGGRTNSLSHMPGNGCGETWEDLGW
jgi:hypothetical protein